MVRRRLFTFAAAASAVLLAATLVLWAVSQTDPPRRVRCRAYRLSPNDLHCSLSAVGCDASAFGFRTAEATASAPDPGDIDALLARLAPPNLATVLDDPAGFANTFDRLYTRSYSTPGFYSTVHERAFVIPFYQATLVLAVLPAIWVAGTVSRLRRRKRGTFCRRCGYDLRATPGRCPECGAVPRGLMRIDSR